MPSSLDDDRLYRDTLTSALCTTYWPLDFGQGRYISAVFSLVDHCCPSISSKFWSCDEWLRRPPRFGGCFLFILSRRRHRGNTIEFVVQFLVKERWLSSFSSLDSIRINWSSKIYDLISLPIFRFYNCRRVSTVPGRQEGSAGLRGRLGWMQSRLSQLLYVGVGGETEYVSAVPTGMAYPEIGNVNAQSILHSRTWLNPSMIW